MPNICINDSRPVFAKKLCKWCWSREYGKPIKKAVVTSKSYTNKINKYSDKRKKQIVKYNSLIKERDSDGKIHYCFFCNKEIKERVSRHHLEGRKEDKLLDDDLLVDCHNSCHLRLHDVSVHILSKESWWNEYLYRLKNKSEIAYSKTMDKFNK